MSTELLSLAIAMVAGLMMTRLFKVLKLNFPDVTAFLIAGVLVGPYCLGAIGVPGLGFNSFGDVQSVELISTVALGFIAFSIGNEFKLSQLRGTGRQAVTVGILQAVTAMVCVDIVLVILTLFTDHETFNLSGALTLGAIATATAPAATLMVVKQYKARGKVTDILLPVVALDDAVGLVAFAVSFGIAEALLSSSLNVVAIIINPLLEIALSLGLGALMGFVLTKVEELFFSNSNRLAMTIGFVFMTIALSQLSFEVGPVTVSFSSLLVCMMLGAVFCNMPLRKASSSNAICEPVYPDENSTIPDGGIYLMMTGVNPSNPLFMNGVVLPNNTITSNIQPIGQESHWYRWKVSIDLDANDGQGAVTLFMKYRAYSCQGFRYRDHAYSFQQPQILSGAVGVCT